jgi:SAM-dependent methyltransferase
MYRSLAHAAASFPRRDGRVLSISHSENLCGIMGLTPDAIVEANYPAHNFLALDFADDSFDFVLSDQVLEHVAGDPQRAIDESLRVLRPGGIAVHTTCFVNPLHACPNDYWRFSPEALRLLARHFSRIIVCEGWGNFEAWRLIQDGLRFDGVPHAAWHPLHKLAMKNDPEWPIHTWVIAQK